MSRGTPSQPRVIATIGRKRIALAFGLVVGTLGLAAFSPSSPSSQSSASPSGSTASLQSSRLTSSGGFVRSMGGQLYLGGMPWNFTGYDDFTLPSTSPGFQCGGPKSDATVDQEFAAMEQHSGSNAVRTWFFQSYGGPGNWQQFDRVLNLAAAHGIHVVATLTNEWLECEGLPKALDAERYRGISWWQGGYRQPDTAGRLSFRDYAVAMAAHYANNPTIAFWQLINEGEAKTSLNGSCDNLAAARAMRAMSDDVSGAMKAVDANHLINLGTMGGGQCGTQDSMYSYVNASPYNDICEIHDYTNQAVMGNQWNGTVPDINACKAMHKSLFAGEVGLNAAIQPNWSIGPSVTSQTLATRASFFQMKMTSLFKLGGVGFMIWSYSLGSSGGWTVGSGDPTQGVMLAEQQKLNTTDLINGLIVTDGDPSPGGSSPGASVAAATAPAPTSEPVRTPNARTAPAIVHRDAPGAARLLWMPLSEWLLHHTR